MRKPVQDPKRGVYFTLDNTTMKKIDEVQTASGCQSRSETVRRIVELVHAETFKN